MAVSFTKKIELYLSGSWTDISADVTADTVTMKRGITGASVTDRVASPGSLSFTLNNAATNSGGLLGYYSPNHANCRAGFDLGTLCRFSVTYDGSTKYFFYGFIVDINPEPGKYLGRIVRVHVADYMERLSAHNINLVEVQLSKRADQLITTVVGNLSTAPLNTSYATGPDTYAYALHSERDENTATITVLQKIAQSGLDYIFVEGNATDGETLTYQSRHTRLAILSSSATLNDTMLGLKIKRNSGDIKTIIRAIAHPVNVDVAATTVLAQSQREFEILAGATITQVYRYRDPTGAATRVSGIEMVTPLVADTDYKMSSISGDNGNDLNANLTVTPTFGGNSVELEMTNSAAVTGYVNKLQTRGKGIYLYDPAEAVRTNTTSVTAYGDRTLSFDLPYCDNQNTVADFADELLRRYKDPHSAISGVEFTANSSTTLMGYAMAIDIGDRVTITETATGLDDDFFVNALSMKLEPGSLVVEWILESTATIGQMWVLGDEALSLLGDTTILGF